MPSEDRRQRRLRGALVVDHQDSLCEVTHMLGRAARLPSISTSRNLTLSPQSRELNLVPNITSSARLFTRGNLQRRKRFFFIVVKSIEALGGKTSGFDASGCESLMGDIRN
jgi:hypothetical protein